MSKRKIEVCFSTTLFPLFTNDNAHVVVVDVLRSTSAICTAFANGAIEVIPVPSVEEAKKYKEKGFLVAAERDGEKLDFADFGNSPFNFTPETVGGKVLAYSTTNGTSAIIKASGLSVSIGSFLNLTAIAKWLINQNEGDLIILCSGWKGKFCMEDSLFAGALCEILLAHPNFYTKCDSVNASLELWNLAKENLTSFQEKIAQRHRLKKLGLDDVLDYCFTLDSTNVVPLFNRGVIQLIKMDSNTLI
jgi:2-phosphosulfolactate phosphatase